VIKCVLSYERGEVNQVDCYNDKLLIHVAVLQNYNEEEDRMVYGVLFYYKNVPYFLEVEAEHLLALVRKIEEYMNEHIKVGENNG